MERKLAWTCCCALFLTIVRGATVTTAEAGNMTTERPGHFSSSTLRDVQSVSEELDHHVHSTTPTLLLIKEMVKAYDNETEYVIKKLELTTVTKNTTPLETTTASTFKMTTSTPDTVTTTTALPTTSTPDRITTTTTKAPTTLPRTTLRPRTTLKQVRTSPRPTTTTIMSTAAVQEPAVKIEPRRVPAPKGPHTQACPRPEDIHPCECVEISSHQNPQQVETVAFCKNIRNSEVLKDAMKGMQGHYINYFVVDSCIMPPFPNGLFNNVGVGWMEVLNSTVQFHDTFFSCSSGCW